jgi:hypothetical protein
MKIGERVQSIRSGKTGTVLSLDEDRNQIKYDDGSYGLLPDAFLALLTDGRLIVEEKTNG